MPRGCVIAVFLGAVALAAAMNPVRIMPAGFDAATMPYLRLLDAKVVTFENHEGIPFCEISGLAYDAKQSLLYAVGDQGSLFHLEAGFSEKHITHLSLKAAYRLKNSKFKTYKKSSRDAEGLVLSDEGLLVSFERKPRILLIDRNGQKIRKVKISRALRDIKNYRGKNSALEAVAYHRKYGAITAPEQPLRGKNRREHTLYAGKKEWRFKAHGSVTALEMMPNGHMLVLERDFNSLTRHRIITLQEVTLCDKGLCPSKLLARFDSSEGWKLDNFEGLTHIHDNLYLMVSDDNDSPLQQTIFVLMEILND